MCCELMCDKMESTAVKCRRPDQDREGVCEGRVGAVIYLVEGNPNPKHVSTSFAERQNLMLRMSYLADGR